MLSQNALNSFSDNCNLQYFTWLYAALVYTVVFYKSYLVLVVWNLTATLFNICGEEGRLSFLHVDY